MFLRTIFAALLGCALLLAPIASTAADRGPSTPEERKQALEYIHDFEANPLGPHAVEEREWVLRWIIEVPDIHVSVCTILDKLPKGDKKDASTVFIAETFSQTAFLIQNPDKQDDRLAEYQAGVEGALRVYEVLLKANPKDRQPFLDDLIERREAGTLAQFVKERAEAACKK
ncbi:MAG: hypothetical protein ABR912_06090 [Terracidiphilus sp.]|jgi:hypothetical protein